MTAPILGPVDEPSAERYEPRSVSDHCEAAKDLLEFLRNRGIRCDVVEVGKNGVRLVGVVDDYPRKRMASAAPVSGDMRDFEEE